MKKTDTQPNRSHHGGRNEQDQQRNKLGPGQQDAQRKSTTSRDQGSDHGNQTRHTGSSGSNDRNDR